MTEPVEDREPRFSWSRIKTLLVGSLAAMVVGLVLVNTYTYYQYGGTMFDRFIKAEKKSPHAGKFAYAKGTGDYVGIIKGEGTSPRRGAVFFIEQAGGQMMEVAKERVEVSDKVR
jgi:hypothetical protein